MKKLAMSFNVTPFGVRVTLQHFIFDINQPQKIIAKGFSPLHSRILFMFKQLKNKNHSIYIDNLYMSASFARNCLCLSNKVKIHGVTRIDKRGIPKCVMQGSIQKCENGR